MHSPRVLATIALGLMVGACATGDTALYPNRLCTVVDGAGNSYEATRLDMVEALETAMTNCSVNADDPASCTAQGCHNVR